MGRTKGKGGGFGGLADAFVKGGVATDKEARKSRRERAEEDRSLGRRGVDERALERREAESRRREAETVRQRAIAASRRDGAASPRSPRSPRKDEPGLPRVDEPLSGTVVGVRAEGALLRLSDGREVLLPGERLEMNLRVSVRCLGVDDRGRPLLERD